VDWPAQRIRVLSHGAMLVFALRAVPIVALDAWIFGNDSQYSLFANSRFLTFAVVAAKCVAERALVARQKRKHSRPMSPGNAILLWTLVMEVIGQTGRSVRPAKSFSVGTVSVSVLVPPMA